MFIVFVDETYGVYVRETKGRMRTQVDEGESERNDLARPGQYLKRRL